MVKHTQANAFNGQTHSGLCLRIVCVFEHFVGLALEELNLI